MRLPACGVLLHITSLPGPGSGGDLGPAARRFVDSLKATGVGWWQTLPLGPPGANGSPYDSTSAFAGAWELLSIGDLLNGDDAGEAQPSQRQRLRRSFEDSAPLSRDFRDFCRCERSWLEDFALFAALAKRYAPLPRHSWNRDIRTARGSAVSAARKELAREVQFECWLQWQFARQWAMLRSYARRNGVRLIGDVPIFVAAHSADVWAHPELFELDEGGRPTQLAAVPPDYFSPHGQLWGNPVYRWSEHRRDGFAWWRRRIRAGLQRFDMLRIDHFRGLVANWRVDAGAATAEVGYWSRGPVRELWRAFRNDPELDLRSADGWPTLFAEDLGQITPAVRRALRDCELWGTRVLQFAGDERSEHHPRNIGEHTVYYSGTHDNDTTFGWLSAMSDPERADIAQRFDLDPRASSAALCRQLARVALDSDAALVVLPLQDILCLDSSARMNTPGTTEGNWRFRAPIDPLPREAADWLRCVVRSSGRAAGGRGATK